MLYDIFEITLPYKDETCNPFDVNSKACFMTEDNVKLEVEGFFDGDCLYRIRFMPNKTGTWHYEAAIENTIVESGSFNCMQSNLKGPLKQDEKHPCHLCIQTENHFICLVIRHITLLEHIRQQKKNSFPSWTIMQKGSLIGTVSF